MTHECFTGRTSVGCKFTAYNWFKCINTRGATLCLRALNTYRGFSVADSDDISKRNEHANISCVDAPTFPRWRTWGEQSRRVMYERRTRPLQENSNFQVWYWANSTEPTLFTAAESDQSNNLMRPRLTVCLWPVAMVPSLTAPQLQSPCYPSGWRQDDPYHSNLDPSSWVRSCCVDSLRTEGRAATE